MKYLSHLSEGAAAGLIILAVLLVIVILVYVDKRKGRI